MRKDLWEFDAELAAHPGLLLRSYLKAHEDPTAREQLLDTAVGAIRRAQPLYRETFTRWDASFEDVIRSRTEYQTPAQSRVIVGLGAKGVLEAGLALHHTYGVPFIPGSGLKGLAAHYCHSVWGATDAKYQNPGVSGAPDGDVTVGSIHKLLFGTTDDAGIITFHDAMITPETLLGSLKRDVLTPHHPKWQTDENVLPTDFDSPIPVSFLSVAGNFVVSLTWHGPSEATPDQKQSWLKLAQTLLTQALRDWGIGGKTSSGYGRLLDTADLKRSEAAKPKSLPSQGAPISGQLVSMNKKGTWRARDIDSGHEGSISNSKEIPDAKEGMKLDLRVFSVGATGDITLEFLSESVKNRLTNESAYAHRPVRKNSRGR